MNLRASLPGDSASSDDEDEEQNRAQRKKGSNHPKSDNLENNSWTRHVNLFILVFLAGILTASAVAFVFAEYYGLPRKSSIKSSSDSGHGLLPDPDHLKVRRYIIFLPNYQLKTKLYYSWIQTMTES